MIQKADNYNQGKQNLRPEFKTKEAGAGFLLAVLALLIPQFVLGIIWGLGQEGVGWRDINTVQAESFVFLIVSGAVLQLFLLLFYWLFTKTNKINPVSAPRIQSMPPRNWLLSAAAGIAALFGLMYTSFAFDILFQDVFKYKPPVLPDVNTAGRAVLCIVFMGIFPAVCDELIFRGIVLRGLAPLGRTKAVLISAAAFAMAHMSPAQTIHQFLLGIIMGLIAWETGSILAPMLIHFINNALSVVLEVSGCIDVFIALPVWEIILLAAVTFCAVCGIIYVILRLIKKPEHNESPQYTFSPDGSIPAQSAKKRLIDDKPAFWFLMLGFAVTASMWLMNMFYKG